MIQEAIARLLDGRHLARDEARSVMDEIMSGEATPAQIAGFLVALRAKGETAAEIAGCAEAMRDHALPVRPERSDLVDTAGTGRRRGADAQHLDRRWDRRRCRRCRRREAREPCGLFRLGLGRRDRGPRVPARAPTGADRALDRPLRLRIHVRAGASSGDATRCTRSARARDTDGLQPHRPADEPRRRAVSGHGRLLARARPDGR